MAEIGAFVIKIAADASGLEKAFHDLGGSAKQFQRGLDSTSKTMQTAFLAGITAAVAFTIQAGKTAEETEQLAQKTGIAAAALEGMTVLLNRNGLSSQSMAMAMKGLSKEIVGVQQGTASSIKLFQEMGLSLAVVEKGTGATLRAIADRFKEMPDGAHKAKLAVDLFGRAGLDWIPMLNKGSAALDQATKKSAEFGLILSDTARGDLTIFDDAMDDMQSALKGFGMQVGIAFAPSMTILVQAFTDAIVFSKGVLNQLSDAASVLAIRIGGMVASVQILGQQIFSTSVFSKDAWKQTLDQVKAIDKWAAAEIKGVAAAREAEKSLEALAVKHLEASQAVEVHGNSQERLGQQIIAATKIQLSQAEQLGKQQERMGADIVSGAKVTMSVDFNEGKRQEALGKRIQEEFDVAQSIAQQWVDAYQIEEDAAMARFQAEMNAMDRNQEAQGRHIVAQAQAAQQVKGFWEKQLDAVVASNAFSVSQIVSTWTSGIANAIVNGGNFVKAAWQATQVAIIQGAINTTVQYGVEIAKRALFDKAAAAGSMAIWQGASTAMVGMLQSAGVAMKTFFLESIVPAVIAVGKFIVGVLIAIAGAMKATVFGIPVGLLVLAGAAALVAALAATGNLGFKEGGIGDFGSGTPATLHGPEAIIPLNSRGASFMQDALGMGKGGTTQPIHTHVYLNGREIAEAVSDDLPGAWRRAGLPA